jgi:thiol-disulfide isomerase/thioredoxin
MHRLWNEKKIRRWLPLLFALLLVLTVTGCGQQEEAAPPIDPHVGATAGKIAPDFTLTTMSGQQVKLSELRGQKIFLNFWASWCPPCKREMPDLQQMSREYEGQVLVYGVNVTSEDTLEKAQEMAGQLALTFPHLLDLNGKVKRDYRVLSLPVSITIGPDGRVVDRHDGQLSHEQMKGMFERLLQANASGT